MMPTYCPKCDEDIWNDLYEEWREDLDFSKVKEFECPHCGAKLKSNLAIDFEVEEADAKVSGWECAVCHKTYKTMEQFNQHKCDDSLTKTGE